MSNSSKMTPVIRGVMRDFRVKNADIFHTHNTLRPTKDYYLSKFRNFTVQLGYKDYKEIEAALWGLGLWSVYQLASLYLLYGLKPLLFSKGTEHSYYLLPFVHSFKDNPEVHYSKRYNLFSNDRLYGLVTLPKRPWEKLKDPENTMKRIAKKHNNTPAGFI